MNAPEQPETEPDDPEGADPEGANFEGADFEGAGSASSAGEDALDGGTGDRAHDELFAEAHADEGGGEEEVLDEDDVEGDEEHEEGLESVTIEITGLSLYTHHGVSDAEREVGQRLMIDLRLEVGETDATVTDRIEDTVDYAEVCQLVALIAQQRSHRTLERLCSTIAERLLADYELEGVWVKATKPEPPIALSVDEVSVEVWREAEE